MSTSSAAESGICRPVIHQTNHLAIAQSSTHPSILPRSKLTSSTDSTSLRTLLNTSAAALPRSFNTEPSSTSSPTSLPYPHQLSKMSTYADRLASFALWPYASPTPEDLARAGLKHRPTIKDPDNLTCQTCRKCVWDWQLDDDIEIQLHIIHPRCSKLWKSEKPSKKPLPSDIGFLDLSLQHDFADLCLFHNVNTFCDRIKRLDYQEADILALLPKCLRGEALAWFNKLNHQDLAICLRMMKSRLQQAPQASSQAAQQVISQSACQAPEYHHCKLCKASFSSMARLIRHTQENICNKPSCRHCETVFPSKNQLHRHLREECRKQTHRSSFSSSSRSSSLSLSTCSPACSPTPSPPPAYRAISPSPPSYLTVADLSARFAKPPCLNIDDLFRMFRPRSAATKSYITIASDDPFARPFVLSKKSMGSIQIWELGLGTSYDQIAQAQCSAPRSVCERCRRSPLLDIDKRQAMPILA